MKDNKDNIRIRNAIASQSDNLPKEPLPIQIHNKAMWNLNRIHFSYNFYTIGYEKTSIGNIIEKLISKGIRTLVDIRHEPYSKHSPEYRKDNLAKALKANSANNITYIHIAELGIPKNTRRQVKSLEDYEYLWKWYSLNVELKINDIIRKLRQNFKQPYAFMCVEFDPTKCHRHLISQTLEKEGLFSIYL